MHTSSFYYQQLLYFVEMGLCLNCDRYRHGGRWGYLLTCTEQILCSEIRNLVFCIYYLMYSILHPGEYTPLHWGKKMEDQRNWRAWWRPFSKQRVILRTLLVTSSFSQVSKPWMTVWQHLIYPYAMFQILSFFFHLEYNLMLNHILDKYAPGCSYQAVNLKIVIHQTFIKQWLYAMELYN